MTTLGVLLMTVGAVLAFAVRVDIDGVDLTAVGIIFMLAGGISIALGLTARVRSRTPTGTPGHEP